MSPIFLTLFNYAELCLASYWYGNRENSLLILEICINKKETGILIPVALIWQGVRRSINQYIISLTPFILFSMLLCLCSKNSNSCVFSSNILFREFALISMWRVPKMPIGAHMLLSFLAEPLKQPLDALLSNEDHDFSENMHEFEDWVRFHL